MSLITTNENVECWGIFQVTLTMKHNGNPFTEVQFGARFSFRHRVIEVDGFYDGDDTYKVRCMPDTEGEWKYITKSNMKELDGIEGRFTCVKPSEGNHGVVRVKNKFHFAYDDGTPYFPIGTTCYVWNHQGRELEEQTLKTLKDGPFNKLRMCTFPKHYDFNHNEPESYPFEGGLKDGWNFERLNPEYFRKLEMRIGNLLELGIEADLILFHPYDRWGFSNMGLEVDERYLRYIVARLSSFRNLWWSFANEYDILKHKSKEDWERLARVVVESDPNQHLRSIHNCIEFYDHTMPWITHCSIQRVDNFKTAENTDEWRKRYHKPVVIDECAYEGNISHGWGNISGQELTRRFWEGTVRGGYVGHGETYLHPEDILWWSHGGVLHGDSPERIGFLRKILEQGPAEGLTPINADWDSTTGGVPGEYYLFYYGFFRPSYRSYKMPPGVRFKVDIIDTWEMTITELPGYFEGAFRIDLPGKEYVAVRMRKAE